MAKEKNSYQKLSKKVIGRRLKAFRCLKRKLKLAAFDTASCSTSQSSSSSICSPSEIVNCNDQTPSKTMPSTSTQDVYEFSSELNESPIKQLPIRSRCSTESPFVDERDVHVNSLEGRRIVNMEFLFQQIKSDRHNSGTSCSFMDSDFVGEYREGFACTWKFRCKMCNVETIIKSDNKDSRKMPINNAAVTGIISSGNGYAALSELSSSMNVPCMSSGTYVRYERAISKAIDEAALSSMLAAGAEEKAIAEQEGLKDADGVPMVRVIGDGFWPQRSYKTKYDSKSGTASIVGANTNQVLFIGIRNRYCSICSLAERKGKVAYPHICFKNWSKSATSMEADIVAEGFHVSEEMHGLRYHEIIADGDSSVYKKLLELMPYGPHRLVKKIECRNHLLRNYSKAIVSISRDSKSGFPIKMRKVLADRSRRLVMAISKASDHRKNEKGPLNDRIQELKKDIINSSYHVFGQHSGCSSYFCSKSENEEEEIVVEMKNCGLWDQLQRLVDNLSNHAGSLIHTATNNPCEILNNVTAKFLSGKRINYCSRSSFNTRCNAAIVSFNSCGKFQTVVHKTMQNGESPGKFTKNFEKAKQKKKEDSKNRRLITLRTKRRLIPSTADKDYGLMNDLEKESEAELEQAKLNYLQSVNISEEEKAKLQKDTEKQLRSDLWMKERRKRLSASHHGAVCHMRASTSCKKQVYSILYSETCSDAMRHGIDAEPLAKKSFCDKYNLEVKACGLFIDSEYPFLSATPDGLVGDNAVIEIKCPTTAAAYPTPEAAIKANKLPYLKMSSDGSIYLHREANYFYQIQSQMRITSRTMCYFYVYTSSWQLLLQIPADPNFWKEKMENKLKRFYLNCLLPELASSRYGKRFCEDDIRDPDYITEAQKKAALKKQLEKDRNKVKVSVQRQRKVPNNNQ